MQAVTPRARVKPRLAMRVRAIISGRSEDGGEGTDEDPAAGAY